MWYNYYYVWIYLSRPRDYPLPSSLLKLDREARDKSQKTTHANQWCTPGSGTEGG